MTSVLARYACAWAAITMPSVNSDADFTKIRVEKSRFRLLPQRCEKELHVTVIFVFDVGATHSNSNQHQHQHHVRRLSADMKECTCCHDDYDETDIDPRKVRPL
jgi:hypothetical protein